jgi:hypothetical protein
MKRQILNKFVTQRKPLVVLLNETWLQPLDGGVSVEGYRSYTRHRVNPNGTCSKGGGVAILVDARIPPDCVTRIPHIKEGGSTGTLGVQVRLMGGATAFFLTTYSEPEGAAVTQLLDMPTVWSERAQSVSHIMADNPLSPIV